MMGNKERKKNYNKTYNQNVKDPQKRENEEDKKKQGGFLTVVRARLLAPVHGRIRTQTIRVVQSTI